MIPIYPIKKMKEFYEKINDEEINFIGINENHIDISKFKIEGEILKIKYCFNNYFGM
jgi:predicted transcriptional regulator